MQTLMPTIRPTALVPIFGGFTLGSRLWDVAGRIPSLDLRFADNKSLVDAVTGASLITFTRAYSGTFVDSAGVLQTAAIDVPRFDHNPTTGESLGLLVEEPRTNSIRNNTMVGAVAGTPGTLPTNWSFSGTGSTSEVVGTGVENGINYIDVRFSGTVTNTNLNFESTTVASASQAWAASSYFKLISGTFTGTWRLTVNEFASGGTFLRTGLAQTFIATNASLSTQRVAGSFTTGVSTASISVLINGQGAATPIDFTLRIGLPQLELGAFATSPILTTTAAATRSADVATITGTAFSGWYSQSEGTVFSAFSIPTSSTTGGARVYSISNSGATTQAWLRLQGGTNRVYEVTDSSTQQAVLSAGTFSAGVLYRGAVALKTNDFGFSENGSTPTVDNSGTLGTVDRMGIGMDSSGTAPLNGHIRRLTFWPQALPSRLQTLTQ